MKNKQCMSVILDIFVLQLLKESLAVLSVGNLCDENGDLYEWPPGRPSYLIKSGRNIVFLNRQPHPLGCPKRANNISQKPVLWVNGSRHVLWATTSQKWKQTDQNGFKYSRKERRQGDLPVRQTSLQLTWPIPPPAPPPSAHPPAKLASTAQFIHSFAQGPELRSIQVCRRTKVTRAPCRNESWRSGGQNENCRKIWRHGNNRPQGSQ